MKHEDLTGRRFGRLVVIEKVNEPGKAKYKVRCDCGREKIVLADNLKRGMTKSCGHCHKTTREWAMSRVQDITGQRFGMLVVLKELGNRKVLCKCDCGNEKIVNKGHLLHGEIKSCGCLLKAQALKNQEKYYKDGTYLAVIKKKEPNRNNTSGHRGVCWKKSKGKWRAHICFKGVTHELGYFDDILDAVVARKKAEEKYFAPALNEMRKVDCDD